MSGTKTQPRFHLKSSNNYCRIGSRKSNDHLWSHICPKRSPVWVFSLEAPWSLTGGHGRMPTPCNKDSTLNEADNRDIRKHSNSSDITNKSKGTPSDHDPCLDRARGWCGQGREEWQPQGQAVLEGIVLLLLQLQKNAFHLPQVCEKSSAKPGYLLTLGRRETIRWAQLRVTQIVVTRIQGSISIWKSSSIFFTVATKKIHYTQSGLKWSLHHYHYIVAVANKAGNYSS